MTEKECPHILQYVQIKEDKIFFDSAIIIYLIFMYKRLIK